MKRIIIAFIVFISFLPVSSVFAAKDGPGAYYFYGPIDYNIRAITPVGAGTLGYINVYDQYGVNVKSLSGTLQIGYRHPLGGTYNMRYLHIYVNASSTLGYLNLELSDGSTISLDVGGLNPPTPKPTTTPTPTPTPTPPPDTTPPARPIGLTGTGADKQAVLKWTSNTEPDLAGYNIYQDGTKVATSSTASTTVDKLTNGKTYSFAVSAYDKVGNESAKSVAVNVTPQDKIDVVAIPNMDSIILQISGGTKPYSVQWGSGNDTVNTTQYTITGLTAETNYTVTVTDANGLKWTSTINTGKDKGYVPPSMPNPQETFQRMIDVFGTAGTIAIAVIGGAVLLGTMCLLALWGWRLFKGWLSRTK